MRIAGIIIISWLLILSGSVYSQEKEKLRVMVLTDIENEPDDAQSLVRFLTYSNMWDIEGLVATTSIWQPNRIADWRIYEILEAYGKVQNNLIKHESGFPTFAYLKSVVKKGSTKYGLDGVGQGEDSEGSEWIISTLKKPDSRPLWVLLWGGSNTLAQALWKINQTMPAAEKDRLVRKLRVYAISDQDNAAPWIRQHFPGLFFIVSPGFQEGNERGYRHGTWIGISGERWYHFPSGADTVIVSNNWVKENIQSKGGVLGAEYPLTEYIMEGDTPSFLYLIENGLGVPERPDYGSWGGRYELYTPHFRKYFHQPETRPIWTNIEDMVIQDGISYISDQATIWRWREAFQNDFAARIQWAVKSYKEANHPPVVKLTHSNVLTVKSGQTVELNATPSSDPDGDQLNFHWFMYLEPGTWMLDRNMMTIPGKSFTLNIKGYNQSIASFIAPKVSKPEEMHLILEVTDSGSPRLTRYERIILNVLP
ncbi:MAG: nucleoside hydrolase-like domain-containing protein [Cyclobacteriaceae bacterium]